MNFFALFSLGVVLATAQALPWTGFSDFTDALNDKLNSLKDSVSQLPDQVSNANYSAMWDKTKDAAAETAHGIGNADYAGMWNRTKDVATGTVDGIEDAVHKVKNTDYKGGAQELWNQVKDTEKKAEDAVINADYRGMMDSAVHSTAEGAKTAGRAVADFDYKGTYQAAKNSTVRGAKAAGEAIAEVDYKGIWNRTRNSTVDAAKSAKETAERIGKTIANFDYAKLKNDIVRFPQKVKNAFSKMNYSSVEASFNEAVAKLKVKYADLEQRLGVPGMRNTLKNVYYNLHGDRVTQMIYDVPYREYFEEVKEFMRPEHLKQLLNEMPSPREMYDIVKVQYNQMAAIVVQTHRAVVDTYNGVQKNITDSIEGVERAFREKKNEIYDEFVDQAENLFGKEKVNRAECKAMFDEFADKGLAKCKESTWPCIKEGLLESWEGIKNASLVSFDFLKLGYTRVQEMQQACEAQGTNDTVNILGVADLPTCIVNNTEGLPDKGLDTLKNVTSVYTRIVGLPVSVPACVGKHVALELGNYLNKTIITEGICIEREKIISDEKLNYIQELIKRVIDVTMNLMDVYKKSEPVRKGVELVMG